MARDWYNRNSGQGNVLKCSKNEITATGTDTPNANIHVVSCIMAAAVTLTGDASNSIIGDMVNIVVQNPTGAALDFILAGDYAAGTVNIGAGGIASISLLFNGVNFGATVTPA